MKLVPLEGKIKKKIVACGRSEVIPIMPTRSAGVYVAVK
jgi:hypothetical protein